MLDVTESSRRAPVYRLKGVSKPDHSAAVRGCAMGQRGTSAPIPLRLVCNAVNTPLAVTR